MMTKKRNRISFPMQSVVSLDKMNQSRPDDRTLDDLFQKTIVSEK